MKIDPSLLDENAIQFAATLLRKGGLVAFPTETVYGIGANLLNKGAIKKLYKIKDRPLNKPFTIHIANIDVITQLDCEISSFANQLIKEFWPGPLTIILKSKHGTLGFRMPKNTVAKALISRSGVPVVAPSANVSGERPPTEVKEILKKFDGKIDLILDGGKTEFRRESTIVDTTVFPYKILREGAVPESKIVEAWNELS